MKLVVREEDRSAVLTAWQTPLPPTDWRAIWGTSVDAIELSVKLASEAAGHALLGVGIPGGDVAVEALLNAVFQIQDQQAQALARIDANIELLLENPWKTAWIYIREAGLPHTTAEMRRKKLEFAADKLREAIPNQRERTFGRAYVNLDLAVLEHILGDEAAADLYAGDAVRAAVGYVQDVGAGKVDPPHATARVLLRRAQSGLRGAASYVGYPTQASLLRKVDEEVNAWLMNMYRELSSVGNAAAVLLGANKQQIFTEIGSAPLALNCRNGVIASGKRLWRGPQTSVPFS
jgi:hypothetical protein